MFDIAVIGAGPIGIELAVALRRVNANYIHFESGELANTIAHYPEQTTFFSSPKRLEVAGYPLEVFPNLKSTKEQYLSYLRGVVNAEGLKISLFSKLVKLERNPEGGFSLGIKKLYNAPDFTNFFNCTRHPIEVPETEIQAKNIVLAVGDMHEPNLLNIPGEELAHVSHGFDKLHSFFGSKVLIVGGRNSAVEAAVRLARLGVEVCLCHRSACLKPEQVKPWLLPDFKSLCREGKITFLGNTKVTEIKPTSVIVRQNDELKTILADKVLLLTGYSQSNGLFSQAGLRQSVKASGNRQTVYDPQTMLAAPGIFIIGTAVAGSQVSDTVEYIETSHVHIPRLLQTLGMECKIPITDSPLRPIDEREQ